LSAPESGIEGVGSNNWVLAGARTTSGKPLLANDPHLKITSPALWYFARLEAPGLKVAGATMPGLPGVVLGQNEHVAWGFTNTNPDVQDLYLERVSADDPAQYQTPDGWARFDSLEETIKVRGAPDVNIVVRSTRHGPVISDVGGPSEGLTGAAGGPSYVLAMRWVALDSDADLLRAPIAANRWRSVNDFVTNAGFFVAPMQNIVVADTSGQIALLSPGRVPMRGPKHDLHGLVPAPGWEARYDWVGFVPVNELPMELNPARGWAGSANQRIHGPDYQHFIATDWAPPFRMERIAELIEAKPKHDLASLRAIQGDELSLAARELLPYLQKARSNHPLAAAAQRELQGFDGTMAADRAAPLIYWAWARQLTQAVLADDMGQVLYDRHVGWRNFREALAGILQRDDASWCDDRGTPTAESCAQQIDAAFGRALDELQAAQGPEVAKWQWGRAHIARAEHRPFSNVGLLARWFELRTPVGGDTHTVNVSRVVMKADAKIGLPYRTEHGPSLRALYDLADPSKSRVMHSTGQSGLVFSPRYRSFLEPWRAVQDVPLWPQEPARDVLTLRAGGPP
jgi:penicillin amidase